MSKYYITPKKNIRDDRKGFTKVAIVPLGLISKLASKNGTRNWSSAFCDISKAFLLTRRRAYLTVSSYDVLFSGYSDLDCFLGLYYNLVYNGIFRIAGLLGCEFDQCIICNNPTRGMNDPNMHILRTERMTGSEIELSFAACDRL